MSHAKPHFNESGGCLCGCRKCIHVSLREHYGHVDVEQKCCCRRCSQDCPSIGRIVSGRAAALDAPFTAPHHDHHEAGYLKVLEFLRAERQAEGK